MSILLIIHLSAWSQITGKVTYVTDGDTFFLLTSDQVKHKVRVADIDCPESKQAFGLEAKAFTVDAVLNKTVELILKEEDRYGRLICFVKYEGKDLSEELLKAGFAWHYKQYSSLPQLGILESEARKGKRGMWAASGNIPPWEFRRSN